MSPDACSTKSSFTHFNVRLEWVKDPRLNATDWLILAEIAALCANKNSLRGGWCYASNAHLGEFIGKSRNWVCQRCVVLEKLGYITQQKEQGGITLRKLTGCSSESTPPVGSTQQEVSTPMMRGCLVESTAQTPLNNVYPIDNQLSIIRQPSQQNDSKKESKKDILEYNPVSVSNFNQRNTSEQISRFAPNSPADGPFDEFMAAYPKPLQLPKARQAFNRVLASGVKATELISAAESFAQRTKAEKIPDRYIPYPANWLINQGWRDEEQIASRASTRPMSHEEALEEVRRSCRV